LGADISFLDDGITHHLHAPSSKCYPINFETRIAKQ